MKNPLHLLVRNKAISHAPGLIQHEIGGIDFLSQKTSIESPLDSLRED
jgi:hypothetical protein